MQFSETSDFAWIVSKPSKEKFSDFLTQLVDGTLPEEISLYYSFDYTIDRQDSQYGSAKGSIKPMLITNATKDDTAFA